MIYSVKTDESGLAAKYGPAMTIFLIAKVGHDEDARTFINGLIRDKEIKSMVYTFTESLDVVREMLVKEAGHKAYDTLVCSNSYETPRMHS